MTARRATARPRPPLHLVPERPEPTVRFQVEPFFVIAPELPALFRRHYRELGRDKEQVPFDPDYDGMMQQAIRRNLIILTARDVETNQLVGYVFNLVGPHLHYKSTLHGCIDMYWLHPAHRVGWSGYNMLKANKQAMKDLGVVRHMLGENLLFTKTDHGKKLRLIFRRLGYKPKDIQYSILLQDDAS